MKFPSIVIGQDTLCCHWSPQFLHSLQPTATMTAEQSGLPIFLENRPSVMCEQVLWLIKNSGLNFQVRETPFSLDINLKKCYTKLWNMNNRNPVSSQPAQHLFPSQNQPAPETQNDVKENSELLHQIELLKDRLKDAMHEKDEACEDLLKLDQAHRKLAKENKDLLKKHEQICSELKLVKSEKDNITKENNTLSVALTTSKHNIKTNHEQFEKERQRVQIELENLNKFKIEKDAEEKKNKKAEKKSRQREKKLGKENSTGINSKDENSNDTLENNSDDLSTKVRLFNQRNDAFKEAEDEALRDVEVEASENIQSVTNISNSLCSSASAPVTKNDLEDLLKSFNERWKI